MDLATLGHEAASRLEGRPLPGPGAPPQLLACLEGRALLRGAGGLVEAPLPEPGGARLDLAPLIDHTLLKAEATAAQVDQLCDEGRTFGFAAVCVNPARAGRAAARLQGSPVRVCAVVGFPLGATTVRQKAFEAASALGDGAQEIDTVLPLGLAKDGAWDLVRAELDILRAAAPHAVLKLILETCALDDAQKAEACRAAADAGFDFVKTSTGFGAAGATEADVALMRRAVGAACGVKASGGIRSYEDALRMVMAGATRLGLSASVAVAQGAGGSTSGY